MSTPRNALGRGIGALIPTTRPTQRADVAHRHRPRTCLLYTSDAADEL